MAKRGGWTRWTETTAAAVLREQRDSGLSMAEFARRRGVHPRRLYRWNARLPPVEAELSGDLEVPSLVPIRVVDLLPAADSAPVPPLELRTADGDVITIPVGFDGDTLLRVLDVLGEARAC